MTNKARSLADIPVAYLMADDSWVWKDDMITFPRDDGFYADDEEVYYEYLDGDDDHPICGEFPHDSIVAPRGWDKVETLSPFLDSDDESTRRLAAKMIINRVNNRD